MLGHDQLDLYPLNTSPTVSPQGFYHLRLSEARQDLSRFDDIRLFALDLSGGSEIATGPDGAPVIYSSPLVPTACRDDRGSDLLDLVSERDGSEAIIAAGGWIEATFPQPGRAGGGVGTDGNPGHKIDPPAGGAVLMGDDGVINLTSLCYREAAESRILDIPAGAAQPDGSIVVRMEAPVEFHIDRLFFATYAPATLEGAECQLSTAAHSISGTVDELLASTDGSYCELASGDFIDLWFEAGEQPPMTTRKLVLACRGQYEHQDVAPSLGYEDSQAAVRTAAFPNPASTSTRVRFSIPAPGGLCAVRVYNIAGRIVRELGTDELLPGDYELEWDGRNDHGEDVAAGVYFVRVDTPRGSATNKLVVIK